METNPRNLNRGIRDSIEKKNTNNRKISIISIEVNDLFNEAFHDFI